MTGSSGGVYSGKSSLCVSFCSHDPTEASEVRRSEKLKWYLPCFVFICLTDHRSGDTVHEGEGRAAGGCIPGCGCLRQDLLLTIWETRKLKEHGRNGARLQSSMPAQ